VLRKAHAWNTENDITGVLCEGQGVYLQVLEGERSKVTRLYSRISADPRHTDLELIHCECITEKRYGKWSMARVSLSDVDPQTKIVWPDLDPYSPSGALVMARIDELIARGELVQPPLSRH
jgi:Sensors of blue-light using FAD